MLALTLLMFVAYREFAVILFAPVCTLFAALLRDAAPVWADSPHQSCAGRRTVRDQYCLEVRLRRSHRGAAGSNFDRTLTLR
ncbi:MAG: hypothetical protein ACXW2I_18625 [Burkholderiales bacterium]